MNKHFIWVFGYAVTSSSAQVNARYSRKLRHIRKIKVSHLALLAHRKSVFVIRIQSEFSWSSPLYRLVFAFSFAFSESFSWEYICILKNKVIFQSNMYSRTTFPFKCLHLFLLLFLLQQETENKTKCHTFIYLRIFPSYFIYKSGFLLLNAEYIMPQ